MKRFAVVIFVVLLAAGIAYGGGYELAKKAGPYNVVVKLDKKPAVVGDNNVGIEIADASAHQIKDAKVELYYFMPSMPAMNYTADAKVEDGAYTSTIKPTMGGEWSLDVKFTRPGEKTHKVSVTFKAE